MNKIRLLSERRNPIGEGSALKLVIIVFYVSVVAIGCEMSFKEIPPEKLPAVPGECIEESTRHDNALFGAYTTGEVSQLQIRKYANEFAECLQKAGLSKAEVKGIIKHKEKTMQRKVEKGRKGLYPF